MNDRSKLIKIGLSVLIAFVILYLGIYFLMGLPFFKQSRIYKVHFDNVSGLAVSSPVRISGYRVGTVRSMEFEPIQSGNPILLVTLNINKNINLPVGSEAAVTGSLFTGSHIELFLGNGTEYLKEGDELKARPGTGDLFSSLTKNISNASSIMENLDSSIRSINQFLLDPQTPRSIETVHATIAQIQKTSQQLNSLLYSIQRFSDASLAPMFAKADTAMGSIATIAEQLKESQLQETIAKMQESVDALRSFSEQLNNKNSTIGKLTQEDELHQEVERLILNADSLIADFKENPKRYIKFSIF